MAKLKEKFTKLDIYLWAGFKWYLLIFLFHTAFKWYHHIFLAYPDGL